jgi:hypothetical protein
MLWPVLSSYPGLMAEVTSKRPAGPPATPRRSGGAWFLSSARRAPYS